MASKKIICKECGADYFKTEQGRNCHYTMMHLGREPRPEPDPLPPPPKQTVERAVSELNETFNLVGGNDLRIGDVFYHIKKYVVIRKTTTEGSDTPAVEGQVTARQWRHGNERFF